MRQAFDPQQLLRPEVAELEEYTPIQPFEVLSKRLGIAPERIVKLDANENPYGPLPAVAEALAEYPFYHIYPDPQHNELRAALSEFVGVPAANILPGHGADELLDYLCRLFLRPGDVVINCPPTFGMYSFDAGLVGGTVVDVWRRPDFSLDIDAIARVVGSGQAAREQAESKLLFLTSPNNPSGTWLADDDLRRLLALPVMVVLDEAYVEFADHPSRVAWVLEHENLAVLRTFSKAAGIAGLRLGYAICPEWLMAQLWKFKQPYNVNVAATVAGLASLRHTGQILDVVESERINRVVDLIMSGYQTDFPVFDLAGRFVGVLTRSQLIQALQATGPETRIVDVMIPAERVPVFAPNTTLDKVFEGMMGAGSRVAAIKEAQDLLGLITVDDITELFQVVGAKLAGASRNQPPGQPASATGVGSPADA